MKHIDPRRDAGLVLGALECLIDGRKAVYLAVPITSGLRLWKLASLYKVRELRDFSKQYPDRFRQLVLKPNINEAKRMSARLRQRDILIIDPSCLMIKEWSQEDYSQLWKSVLKTRVSRIALSPNWVYSLGCLDEYLVSVKSGLQVTDLDGNEVTYKDAESQIRQAECKGNALGINTLYLRKALRHLKQA